MAKTIYLNPLSATSVAAAIADVKAYRSEVKTKTVTFRQKLASKLEKYVRSGFSGEISDEYWNDWGTVTEQGTVTVTTTHTGNTSVVLAAGEDAVWIEFGTGVKYNSGATHPDAAVTGMTIGSYGQGNGKKTTWGFYDQTKELWFSHGVRMSKPMANAMDRILSDINSVAREVFG